MTPKFKLSDIKKTVTYSMPSQILQLHYEIPDTNNTISKTTTHNSNSRQSRSCGATLSLTTHTLLLLHSCHQMWSK